MPQFHEIPQLALAKGLPTSIVRGSWRQILRLIVVPGYLYWVDYCIWCCWIAHFGGERCSRYCWLRKLCCLLFLAWVYADSFWCVNFPFAHTHWDFSMIWCTQMYMSRLHLNASHICNYIYIYNIINNGLFLEQEAILFQKESNCPGLKEEAADFWNGQGIHVP